VQQEVARGEVWVSLGAEVLQSRAPPAAALWRREQRVVRAPNLDLHFLQSEVCPGLRKGRERAMHLEDGHHVAKLTVQATVKREHHLPIADWVVELGEGGGHRLEAVTVVGDVQGTWAEVAKLSLEEERA
jgi:hypothetical protein